MRNHDCEQSFDACVDALMAIDEDALTYCNIPLEIATAEATQLGIVAAEDRDQLLASGIDPVYVDSLGTRAAAFSWAAARYELATSSDPEATKIWKAESLKGFAVQKYLIRHLCREVRG